MGDPKKNVSRYSGPRHPWEADRLAEEKVLIADFGLKNKKDIWKQSSYVKKIKDQVKKINISVGKGIEQEEVALIKKLVKYNLLNENQPLEEALELTTRDIMERRLQTQVVRQGLARTMKQARQFIVHGHIKVNGKKITSPSFLVSKEEQFQIEFQANSSLSDEEHPERKTPEVAPVVEEKAEEPKEGELTPEEIAAAKEIEAKIDDSEDVEVEVKKETTETEEKAKEASTEVKEEN